MRPVLFITCVLFVCHPVCDGYSEGAPVEACTALKPLHDSEPETRETPYTFTAYHDFVDDQTPIVNVTILGSDRVWFKGFLLQARDNNDDLIGEFIDHRDNSIFVECSEHDPRSSVTQKRAFPKKSVNFIWKPPAGYTGKVTFRATIVQHEDIYFMGHETHLYIPKGTIKTGEGIEDKISGTSNGKPSDSKGHHVQSEL